MSFNNKRTKSVSFHALLSFFLYLRTWNDTATMFWLHLFWKTKCKLAIKTTERCFLTNLKAYSHIQKLRHFVQSKTKLYQPKKSLMPLLHKTLLCALCISLKHVRYTTLKSTCSFENHTYWKQFYKSTLFTLHHTAAFE